MQSGKSSGLTLSMLCSIGVILIVVVRHLSQHHELPTFAAPKPVLVGHQRIFTPSIRSQGISRNSPGNLERDIHRSTTLMRNILDRAEIGKGGRFAISQLVLTHEEMNTPSITFVVNDGLPLAG